MATIVVLSWFSVASELISALLEKCSTTDEVEAWTQEEENEEELADALMEGELDGSEIKWRVYAALERLDLLNTTEMLQEPVVGRKYKTDDEMSAAYSAVRADVRTAFKDATGLEGGGPDCEGDTVIEFNADGTIDTIDDYWIAATNGSTWEVQFDAFDFTFSLNNNPDD